MADEVDRANQEVEIGEAVAVLQAQQRAAAIPKGEPGDCDLCGEWSARLAGGACAPCRDRYKLP